MSKRRKMKFSVKLLIVMTLYAVVFAALAVYGLNWFWGYIAAYENSRPQNTIEAYMAQLEISHIQNSSSELIAQIDHNIQSEEQCRETIADALSGGISYARKLSECTDNRTVYMLLSGGKTIGKVTLSAQAEDQYGFTPWTVSEEAFDLSFLIGEGTTVTVPHDYPVYVNGTRLSEDYIVQRDIRYGMLEDFYGSYPLPTMVTYQVNPILGQLQVTIADLQGNEVSPESAADEVRVLNNCTEAEITTLDTLVEGLIGSYVDFTTCKNNDLQGNYQRVITHMVPGGALADRMYDALGGLKWVSDRNAQISSLTMNHRIRFLDGRYLCDVTYIVDSIDHGIAVQTINNAKIIFVETEDGLKAETMLSY